MRKLFAEKIRELGLKNENICFLTGDLGYLSLEEVRDSLKERFINVGIAEQNLVSLSAGMAYEGFIPFIYSIVSFLILRPFEQIRNDICFHDLPVKLVGNGGGYGYGIMGATHHALEDIGAMKMMPNMKVFIPYFADDVGECIEKMLLDPHPNYLRLNVAVRDVSYSFETFKAFRKLKSGNGCVVIGSGPVLNNIFQIKKELLDDLEIWLVSLFPFGEIPEELIETMNKTKKLIFIEEHKQEGSIAESLSLTLLKNLEHKIKVLCLHAKGYISGKYGSQKWHQNENSLAGKNLEREISKMLLE